MKTPIRFTALALRMGQSNDGSAGNAADQRAFVFDAQHIEEGKIERPWRLRPVKPGVFSMGEGAVGRAWSS